MAAMYYDAFLSGLVPVRPIEVIEARIAGTETITVKVTRTKGAYKRGEVLDISRIGLVYKTRRQGHHQMVTTVPLDDIKTAIQPSK